MAAQSLSTIPAQVLQVYSREAILAAQPLFVYRNFVEYKEQLGIEPGKTITFLKLANLTGGGLLNSEFDPIFKEAVQESTVSITVYEAGGATSVTRAALEAPPQASLKLSSPRPCLEVATEPRLTPLPPEKTAAKLPSEPLKREKSLI
jgi:hypothetical protein